MTILKEMFKPVIMETAVTMMMILRPYQVTTTRETQKRMVQSQNPVVTRLHPTTTIRQLVKTMLMRGLTCEMKMMLTMIQVILTNFVIVIDVLLILSSFLSGFFLCFHLLFLCFQRCFGFGFCTCTIGAVLGRSDCAPSLIGRCCCCCHFLACFSHRGRSDYWRDIFVSII